MVVLDRQDRDSVGGSGDAADDSLRDVDLQAEIELVADLVLAASGSETALTAADIDQILGVVHPAVTPAVPLDVADGPAAAAAS